MRRLRWLSVLALAAVVAPGAPSAPAAAAIDQVVTTVAYQFAPAVVVVEEGGGLVYANADVAPHDVTATEEGPDGRPRFASDTIVQGETARVHGVDLLPLGSYGFLCTLHPEMRGTLEVVERVTPTDLPGLDEVPTLAAGAVPTPTSITVVGDYLYAASYVQGVVYELPILAGGALGAPVAYATGFSNPLGIVFDDVGWLYVSDSHPSARDDRSTAGRVWALPPGGGDAGVRGEIVVDELPNGRHNTNGLAVHRGRLWITNGNSTDDGTTGGEPEEPLSGTILSARIGARALTPADLGPEPEPDEPLPDLLLEASGLRNPYDLAFRPGTDELWIPVNGPDELDPYGEDTLVAARDVRGGPPDFGFPACVHGRAEDGGIAVAQNPAVSAPCGEHTMPEQLLGLHTSADGLAFGPDDETWGGDLYIARFGNFFGSEVVGHDVVRLPMDAGVAGEPETVVHAAAPLDVAFGPAGLYIADFAAGQILLLSAPPPPLP